jgi:hypothetical protein
MALVPGRLVDLWRRVQLTSPRINGVHYFESVETVPDVIDRHTLAVVGNPDRPKWIILECPCGRHHRLMLSLQRGYRPAGKKPLHDSGPSVWPSIDSAGPDRCHFILRRGHVLWVKGSA